MKKIAILISLAAILFSAACSSVNTVENAQKLGVKQMVSDKRIITDSALDDVAYIAGVNESLTPTGLKKVQVELVNRTEEVRNVNYCFEWFDRSGMLVTLPSPVWITIAIDAGESRFISAVAPTPNAADFRVKLLGNVRSY